MSAKIVFCILLSHLPGLFSQISLKEDLERIEDNFWIKNAKQDVKNDTEPSAKCNLTLFSENDLKDMIDVMAEDLKIYEKLNASYYENATATRDSIKQKIDGFISIFVERPPHLKHILADLALKYQYVDAYTFALIQEFEEAEKHYNESIQKYLKLVEEPRDTNWCNCYDNDYAECWGWGVLNSATANGSDSTYCGSFKAVHELINSKLQSILNETFKYIENKIQTEQRAYNEKVEDFKQKTKKEVLNEFGEVMFDILNIQDQYIHLSEELDELKFNVLYHIFNQLSYIEMGLIEMEYLFGRHEYGCGYCTYNIYNSLQTRNINVSQEESDNIETDKIDGDKPKDILEALLETKMKDIKNKIDDDFVSIFDDINQILAGEQAHDVIKQLIELLPEINDITQKEMSNIEQLKTKVTPETISNIKILSQYVDILAEQIELILRSNQNSKCYGKK